MDATNAAAAVETVSAEYTIPECNLEIVQAKLEKLARKAARLGLPAISLEKIGEIQVPYVMVKGKRHCKAEEKHVAASKDQSIVEWHRPVIAWFKFAQVRVTGQRPRLAGWEFVATLQHLADESGEIINLLRTVPSFKGQLPAAYRTATPENCDHCQKAIKTRKETFIVRHQDGTWKQVGRNCTQDFLGNKDPHAVAKQLEDWISVGDLMGEAEEGFGWGDGYAKPAWEIGEFLEVVADMVRVDGWVSRGQSRATDGLMAASADQALLFLNPPDFGNNDRARADYREWKEKRRPADEDKATAEKALAHAREDLRARPELNDYLHNLVVACSQEFISHKLAGITASLIPYYIREVERQALKAREAQLSKASTYAGQVGERSVFKVTVLSIRTIESAMYGSLQLHKMVTPEGQILTWFGSGEALKTGKDTFIKATVKRHDEYKGVKQTVVNRASEITAEEYEKELKKAARKAAKAAEAQEPIHA